MVTSFRTVVDSVKNQKNKKTIVVAAAEQHDILAATVQAKQEGLADVVYIGDSACIRQLALKHQLDISDIEIIEASNASEAGRIALGLVKTGKVQALMKGKIMTGQILGMILKDEDLKEKDKDRFLSHVSIFEWGQRLRLFSDPALTIAPNVEQKRRIALNAIYVAQKLGIHSPRVAFLSAVEKVNPKMPSSVDAAELAAMEWGDAIVDGPLAIDGALFEEAYRAKESPSPLEGKADILICPNIETANLFYKTLAWIAKLDIAGTLVGAGVPLIIASRADSARTKFLSIAITLYLAE